MTHFLLPSFFYLQFCCHLESLIKAQIFVDSNHSRAYSLLGFAFCWFFYWAWDDGFCVMLMKFGISKYVYITIKKTFQSQKTNVLETIIPS